MSSSRRRRRRGFTLMEVLLVLAILVVLGSLVGVSIFAMQRSSNVKLAQTQIGMLENSIKAYQIDIGTLPPSLEALVAVPAELKNPAKWSGPYVDKGKLPVDPWGNAYTYEPSADINGYVIKSAGPDQQPGTADDVVSS